MLGNKISKENNIDYLLETPNTIKTTIQFNDEGLIYAFAGFQDIPIQNHSDFSKRFYLLGEDEQAIKQFFDDEIVHFFESNPYYHIESNGKDLLIFDKERLASIKEIKAMFDFGKRLNEVVQH